MTTDSVTLDVARKTGTKKLPPLTIAQWRNRQLPEIDWVLGQLFSTTSRVLLAAPSGLGKTNFSLRLAAAIESGTGLLHWPGSNKRHRVLVIDGELPRAWAKKLLLDLERRMEREGIVIGDTFFYINTEDAPEMPPLNTEQGRQWLFSFIDHIGGVDFIVFDNLMSLLSGDMKEEESWKQNLPLVLELTSQCVGQLWIDHTGHNETRGYGSSVKKWQLDTSILLKKNDNAKGIDFTLTFDKSRMKTPENEADYQEVSISLVNDEWVSSAPRASRNPISKQAKLALDNLSDFLARHGSPSQPYRDMTSVTAGSLEGWREHLKDRGVTDRDKPANERSQWRRIRENLMAAGFVAIKDDFVWLVRDSVTKRDMEEFCHGPKRDVT